MATAQAINANAQRVQWRINDGQSNASVHIVGAFAGLNAVFEASLNNGADWFTVDASRSTGNIVENNTGVLGAAPAYSWDISVGGFSDVSLRATAFTSGSASVLVGVYAGGSENAPVQTAAPAGAALTGDVGIQYRPNATGAATPAKVVAAASTNATVVKASAGRMLGFTLTPYVAGQPFRIAALRRLLAGLKAQGAWSATASQIADAAVV